MSYQSAIKRKAPSLPAQKLFSLGRLNGRALDYGCGKGFDAHTYAMERYDPFYAPDEPIGEFDVITCTYFLDTLGPYAKWIEIKKICSLLADGGTAYLSVRRDIGSKPKTWRGCLHSDIRLPFQILYENKSYAIYTLTKKGDLII